MGCSSSSSGDDVARKDNDFVVDDISDPKNIKAPIETDNGYGPGRATRGEPATATPSPPTKRPSATLTTTTGKSATNQNTASTAPTATAAATSDARSRYAMEEEPAASAGNDDNGGVLPGLPGLGGLPSFAPRRYEDVHPPVAQRPPAADDEDDDNEVKPQGDQAVTDLFRRYADNARGGGRPKTVVMRPPAATFGALADQSKANTANDGHPVVAPLAASADNGVSGSHGNNGASSSLIAASTITSGRDDNDHDNGIDDDPMADVSSSRIGHLKMTASGRRSHSESHNQRSSRRHRAAVAAGNGNGNGAVANHSEESESQPGRVNNNNGTPLSSQPTIAPTSNGNSDLASLGGGSGSTHVSARHQHDDDDDEFG